MFLAFVSSDAVNSENVKDEIFFAIDKNKPFLCVNLEQTELPDSLQFRMGRKQAINRHRLTEELYRSKLCSVLPDSLKRPEASMSADASQSIGVKNPRRKWLIPSVSIGMASLALIGVLLRFVVFPAAPDAAGKVANYSSAPIAGDSHVWRQTLSLVNSKSARAAEFSADDSHILVASEDQTAMVWNLATKAKVLVFQGHKQWVLTANYSPDFKKIVTASEDHTAGIWDAITGQRLLVISGHAAGVNTAAWSPDGHRILTSSADGTARVWDSTTGAQIFELRTGGSAVNEAVYSPDGKMIATASDSDDVNVWDAATGNHLWDLDEDKRNTNRVSFSPDSKRLASSEDNNVLVWDMATGKKLLTITGHTDQVLTVVYSPNGSLLLSASIDGHSRGFGRARQASHWRFCIISIS